MLPLACVFCRCMELYHTPSDPPGLHNAIAVLLARWCGVLSVGGLCMPRCAASQPRYFRVGQRKWLSHCFASGGIRGQQLGAWSKCNGKHIETECSHEGPVLSHRTCCQYHAPQNPRLRGARLFNKAHAGL